MYLHIFIISLFAFLFMAAILRGVRHIRKKNKIKEEWHGGGLTLRESRRTNKEKEK